MTNVEILKILARNSRRSPYWTTMSRYLQILENHVNNHPLSRVERVNHPHSSPRLFYIDILARGLGFSIDYSSDLWERRLDLKNENPFWSDDTWAYYRFFSRLNFCKKENIPLTEELLDILVRQGTLYFNETYPKYKEYEQLDLK